MKTLVNPKVTVNGTKVTIECDIVDQPWNSMLTRRVSHAYMHPLNPSHPARIMTSNAAVFMETRRAKLAMSNDTFASIAMQAEPKTAFAPVFKDVPPSSDAPCLTVQTVSVSPVTLQWQQSASPAGPWADLAGQTGATVDETVIPFGQYIRCVATNATGSSTMRAVLRQKPIPPPQPKIKPNTAPTPSVPPSTPK